METGQRRKIQIITLGDHMVGKTSILRRFNDGTFTMATYTTIGIDFVAKDMLLGEEKVSVKIWDTAGQDRFHTITHSFYKQCQGVLLVFDVGSKSSFNNVHKWMSNIERHADQSIIKYLLGNKTDTDKREVAKEEAQKVAEKYHMRYFECSAKTNMNIEQPIVGLVTEICGGDVAQPAAGFGLQDPSQKQKQKPKGRSCCS